MISDWLFGTAWTKAQTNGFVSRWERVRGWLRWHIRNAWHCRFGHNCKTTYSHTTGFGQAVYGCGITHPEGRNTCCCECISSVAKLMG